MKEHMPGQVSLWPALERATQHALRCGALQPIESTLRQIDDAGVRFVVRRFTRAARLAIESRRQARTIDTSKRVNPFLPFDPDLFVADVSATHVALLNKFNLIVHHMLIVTRRFVPQEVLLDDADIAALCACLADIDGLIFYNGGATAGASQSHKHLQMVPLPLGTGGLSTPIDAVLDAVRDQQDICTVPGLGFRHSFAWIAPASFGQPASAGARLTSLYPRMLERIGVSAIERDGERYQSAPWNLLVTRRWVLAVPRVREDLRGVSINALGFAGLLVAQDDARFATLKRVGPMAVLKAVSGPG
jgi:sulfate adenylyltransferase (ADP) / ATP adenylyltransferase